MCGVHMTDYDECLIRCECGFLQVRGLPRHRAKEGTCVGFWCNKCGSIQRGLIVENIRKNAESERVIFT